MADTFRLVVGSEFFWGVVVGLLLSLVGTCLAVWYGVRAHRKEGEGWFCDEGEALTTAWRAPFSR